MGKRKIDAIAFGGLQAEIKELRTPQGLIIDSIKLSVGPAKVSTDPFSLIAGSPGQFEARVTPEALRIYLDELSPGGAKDFDVRFEDDQIRVAGTATVLIQVRAEAVCQLRIEKGQSLFVDLVSADVFGIGASGIIERQIEAINPVLDVSTWPVPVKLESVSINSDAILLKGSVLPTKP